MRRRADHDNSTRMTLPPGRLTLEGIRGALQNVVKNALLEIARRKLRILQGFGGCAFLSILIWCLVAFALCWSGEGMTMVARPSLSRYPPLVWSSQLVELLRMSDRLALAREMARGAETLLV